MIRNFDTQLCSWDVLGVTTWASQSSSWLGQSFRSRGISAQSPLLLLWFSALIVTFSGQRSSPKPGHRWLSNSEADEIERLGMRGAVELRSGGEGESEIGSGDHHKVRLSWTEASLHRDHQITWWSVTFAGEKVLREPDWHCKKKKRKSGLQSRESYSILQSSLFKCCCLSQCYMTSDSSDGDSGVLTLAAAIVASSRNVVTSLPPDTPNCRSFFTCQLGMESFEETLCCFLWNTRFSTTISHCSHKDPWTDTSVNQQGSPLRRPPSFMHK